ncbi:hypothetical protein [Nonomuraea insulae]|uniref:Glycosyltransferase RgtA/B/C/D-like domain-containing protein n=1 Tax=Nonomuraea insulae TaxID=1616787 RepID=A0ABW1CMU5_9ACTN
MTSLRSRWALLLVALCYGIVQLIAVSPGMGLGWDEVVYVSQVDPRVPAAEFIAPRARGITLLVAPVVLVTSSTEALRVYLCVLSALGLYVSFGTWLRIRPGATAPLAALLFASTWLAVFYGNEAMPNLWVAFGAVAAVGCFLRCARPDSGRGAAVGLAVSVAAVALLRPPDSIWLVLPLALALARPAWRLIRPGPPLDGNGDKVRDGVGDGRRWVRAGVALVAGLVVGWADWIVEAYVRFGGFAARWQAAGAANETGLHVTLLDHIRALNGPLLCRPPAHCGPVVWPWLVWWLAIPVLVLLGLYAAARRDRLPECALPAICGLTLAVPYVFLVGYAAPRFLLPAYALLVFPIAHALLSLKGRPAAGLAAAGVLAQFVLQGLTLEKIVSHRLSMRGSDVEVAEALRALNVRPPCLVYGEHAVMIAYRMGCDGYPVLRWPAQAPAPVLSSGKNVVAVAEGRTVPAPLRTWGRGRLTGNWYAYQPR